MKMKKLIGLFAILFITTGVFGQISFDVTELLPQSHFKYSLKSKFVEDGKQYAIAYDSVWIETSFNPHLKKDIYLWRKDGNKWTIASDVLRTDYVKYENGVKIYVCWVDNDSSSIERNCDLNLLFGDIGGYSYVESIDGLLCIRILSFSGIIGNDKYDYQWSRIWLIPNENGFYERNIGYGYRSSL